MLAPAFNRLSIPIVCYRALSSLGLDESLRKCLVYKCLDNPVAYFPVWAGQKKLQLERRQFQGDNGSDALVVVQHNSMFTLGRGSDPLKNFKFDPNSKGFANKIVTVERGGEVTWHGPGQVVLYPILDLAHHKKDLHWYVRSIEEIVIRTLKDFDINASRIEGLPGVWTNGTKICSIGISCSWWITMHGFALNINPDFTEGFDQIFPCGLKDKVMSRMIDFNPKSEMNNVVPRLLYHFKDIFKLNLVEGDFNHLLI